MRPQKSHSAGLPLSQKRSSPRAANMVQFGQFSLTWTLATNFDAGQKLTPSERTTASSTVSGPAPASTESMREMSVPT